MNPTKEENAKTENSSYMLPDGNVIEVCAALYVTIQSMPRVIL